ncbi:tRNA dimethylallyltransferase [Bacilli bacterium PM5-3]|nr:tRNA dimethylallyltransferase [Bacilli bacterium PM5-3]
MDKVICIVGPTGIGKTKLSIELAKFLDTEIINCDAIQVFKDVNILSAKATVEEQEKIKHHLLDYLELDERLDVANFRKDASNLIKELNSKGKIPILVGGSGLYLKSLIYDYNLSEIKGRESKTIEKYQNYSNEELFSKLESIDMKAASILHPNNRKRVLRAIEIFEESNIKKSDFIEKQEHKIIFDALIIGLEMPREELYERINIRVDHMIENGLLEEVDGLYQMYQDKDYQVFQAIGYKEFLPYYNNEMSIEESIAKVKQNSRKYAKKQITWFKNQMNVEWLLSDVNDFDKTIAQAKIIVKDFLNDERTI